MTGAALQPALDIIHVWFVMAIKGRGRAGGTAGEGRGNNQGTHKGYPYVGVGLGSDASVEGGPVEVGGNGEGEAGDVAARDLDSLPLGLVGGPYE